METITALHGLTGRTFSLFQNGFEEGARQKKPNARHIILCGMGGSILGAELFEMLARAKNIPIRISVWQTYAIPPGSAKKDTHAYCISYSGNTEETLSSFHAARAQGIPVTCLTRGGKLEQQARRTRSTTVLIPDTIVPRLSAPWIFGFFAGVFARKTEIKFPSPLAVRGLEREARRLAETLAQKHILVYTPVSSMPLAHLWEINLNETAGLLAFGDDLPDIDHHALTALSRVKRPSDFSALFLSELQPIPKITKRIALTKQTLSRFGVRATETRIPFRNAAWKIVSHIFLSSLASLHMAAASKFDPLANTVQEQFKRNLRRS